MQFALGAAVSGLEENEKLKEFCMSTIRVR